MTLSIIAQMMACCNWHCCGKTKDRALERGIESCPVHIFVYFSVHLLGPVPGNWAPRGTEAAQDIDA